MNKVPFACVAALCAAVCAGTVRAQESRSLCDQLNSAASAADARNALNKSQETFATAGRYSDFVEQLLGCSLKNKKVPLALVQFAIASCRFDQLNYLEQQQLWDEYFNRGDEYRRQINDTLTKVIADTPAKDSLHLSARVLFWQFHRNSRTPCRSRRWATWSMPPASTPSLPLPSRVRSRIPRTR